MLNQRIVPPSEIVDYSTLIINQYERPWPGILQAQPMVGYKVLLRDHDSYIGSGQQRLMYLESQLPKFINGSGVFLRETNNAVMPDGFWLVSLPVPLNQVNDTTVNQMQRMFSVLNILDNCYNISPCGRIEVNVSGRCTEREVDSRMSMVSIPDEFKSFHIEPDSWGCKLGTLIRINPGFLLVRTKWDVGNADKGYMKSVMTQLTNIISRIFY